MGLSTREHPEAFEELRDAANWYDDRQRGLGDAFYDAIDEALHHILDWPLSVDFRSPDFGQAA